MSTALVNIHVKGPPLVHAIRTALGRSKDLLVVVDESLADCVLCHDVLAELPAAVRTCRVASRVPFRSLAVTPVLLVVSLSLICLGEN